MVSALGSFVFAKDQIPVPTLSFSYETGPVEVETDMLYLEDAQQTLTLNDVTSRDDLAWREIKKASSNFGFTDSAFWFRFDVDNTETISRKIIFELPIPFLDDIELYQFIDGQAQRQYLAGDKFAFEERPVKHQKFLFPFELEPGANEFLVRIQTAGTVEAPLTIWSPTDFIVADGNDRLMQGIWFGVMGIMILYNLFLLALLKDSAYFFYVGFVFNFVMFQSSLKGYGFAYMWPEATHWNSYAISVFIAASNFFAFMLVLRFLDLPKYNPKAAKVTMVFAAAAAVLFVLTFVLPYSATVRINSAMAAVTCIVAVSLGYWSWFNRNPLAKYFCLAWTSVVIGIVILLLAKFGAIPAFFWTNNAGQVGAMGLVTLLSFVLASRFDREKEMRLRAQESSLENERLARQSQDELLREKASANERLERKVEERTETLQKALAELETANERLEILSTTDELTNLFNRRHFEACFLKEFKRSVRHQRKLSIILFDVDRFKGINDHYGHPAGDECLQAIATLLKQRINRSGDMCARYGGEEFIVLLSDTDLPRAGEIAEDLRKRMEAMDFRYNGEKITVTSSFGVASLDKSNEHRSEELVKQADLALYKAKHAGRNCVILWDPNDPSLTLDSDQIG